MIICVVNTVYIPVLLTFRALMSTAVDILCFINSCITHSKIRLQSRNSDTYWDLNFTNYTIHFQSLEVVYRVSETQLQVTENLSWIAQ